MNILGIANRLREVASLIENSQSVQTSKHLVDEADRFLKALQRFEGLLKETLRGDSPSAIEFKYLMKAHFTEQTRSVDELGDFSKKVLGKKTTRSKNSSYSEYLDKVIGEIIAKDRIDLAIALLKRLTAKPLLDFSSQDTEHVLLQVRRLGSLTDEQVEVEKMALLKDPEKLGLLATTAGIKIKPTYKPETLFKKLLCLAKRYYENTGL